MEQIITCEPFIKYYATVTATQASLSTVRKPHNTKLPLCQQSNSSDHKPSSHWTRPSQKIVTGNGTLVRDVTGF